ncbi:SDR family oxidoreductase [Sorangium sp. So ce131]|uniref:SDR family oxidoreductase n=1 Tax=Sorangium sp. So ce131 TaxID=3133282 RepID=UPI003F61B50C
MKPLALEGQVALVAGATRGAGRAIACSLGEAGATVYCTGRSVRGRPATDGRPETIEETAEMVAARGGRGLAVQVDHTVEEQVAALCAQIKREQGKLDVLVNDVWGGDELTEFGAPFWKLSIPRGKILLERAVTSHIITSRHAVPLLLERGRGLIVEVTDGDHFGYRGNLFYDLAKMSVIRLAFAMAWELKRHPGITALAVTPGFLRSEAMLDHFGVTEATWQDGTAKDPHFIASETPYYVGRAVAALAADPDVAAKAGRVLSSWDLAREYGFTDVDGRQPHWGDYFEKTFGRYNRADEQAYASWFNGPMDLAAPDWPKE